MGKFDLKRNEIIFNNHSSIIEGVGNELDLLWPTYMVGEYFWRHLTCFTETDLDSCFSVNVEVEPTTKSLKLFPNPTSGKIFIEISEIFGKTDFMILDQLGREILKGTFNPGEQIDASSLNPGIYYLKIELEQQTVIKKFAK